GLHPDVYSWSFVIAAMLVAGAAVLELREVFAEKREGSWFWNALKRPSIGMIVVAGLTSKLVKLDVQGTDIPDVLTTTLLLLLVGYVYFILPIGLTQLAWRLTRWMWRVGTGSGFGAGVLGTLALVLSSCLPVCQCTGEDDDESAEESEFSGRLGDAFDKAEIRSAGKGVIEGARVGMEAFAEVIPNEGETNSPDSSRPWSAPEGQERFDLCIDELVKPKGRSPSHTSIRYFERRGLPRVHAEELVQATVLEVCIGHANEPLRNIESRFRRRTHQRKINAGKKRAWRGSFECDVNTRAVLYGRSGLSHDERLSLENAICLLDDPRDREILIYTARSYEADEIGRLVRPKLSAAAVRQRRKRAINKIKKLLR
ncbi:MAG: hypothetical protein ACPG4T_21955, partial [Nannocystaceae bacterium]